MITCIEEMRPGQIAEIVNGSSMVFIPVSPRYEWHSYQLAVGCDGIVAEESARILAEHFNGAYFRCLSIGLDQWRDDEFKKKIGLPADEDIFGMRFPGLPVESEYHTVELMKEIVAARLNAVKGTGLRYAFITNHHGGQDQDKTLKELAEDFSGDGFHAEYLRPSSFNTFKPAEEFSMHLKVGGHAGLSETTLLMAFRPDLVDLEQIPDGPLKAAEMGILHNEPDIPEKFNPRRALPEIAKELKKSIVENMITYIEKIVHN